MADERHAVRLKTNLTLEEMIELERRALVRGVSVAKYLRETALAPEPLALAPTVSRRA